MPAVRDLLVSSQTKIYRGLRPIGFNFDTADPGDEGLNVPTYGVHSWAARCVHGKTLCAIHIPKGAHTCELWGKQHKPKKAHVTAVPSVTRLDNSTPTVRIGEPTALKA